MDPPDGGRRSDTRADSADSLHWLCLTFREEQTEKEYLRHSQDGLCVWAWWASLAVITLSLFSLGHRELRQDDKACLDRSIALSTQLAVIVVMLVNMILCYRRVFERVGFAILEAYTIFSAHLLLGVIIIVVSTRSHTLLLIACLTTAFSVNPHLRWHRMLPLHFSCVLAYAVPAFFLDKDDDAMGVLMFTVELAILQVMASHGRRIGELRGRQYFASVIVEKTARVTSEFQLSQVRQATSSSQVRHACSSSTAGRQEDVRSLAESVPTTTDTGRIFQLNGEVLPQQWDALQGTGRREQWLIDAELLSWRASDILGIGGYGIVVRGEYQGVPVAVKVPKVAPQTTRPSSYLTQLCNELQILRRLRHPHIVGLFGAWLGESDHDLALVLELVDGVSLRSFVHGNPENQDRARVLPQVSCALQYLHTRQPQVVHGDLKDSNIFIERPAGSSSPAAKLLDFGLARRVTKHARPMGGTLLWAAPEVVKGTRAPDPAADIFSFGRVAYFVVTGTAPGEGRRKAALLMDLKTGTVAPLAWPADPFPRDYQGIVDTCIYASPQLRPPILEVHASMAALREKYSGAPSSRNKEMGELHKELRVLRTEAGGWKARKLAAAPVGGRASSSTAAEPQENQTLVAQGGALPPAEVSSGNNSSACLLYPDFETTPVATQANMLTTTLVRWNIAQGASACCEYHAAMHNLRQLVDMLGAKGCKVLGLSANGQCAHCGLIITEDDFSLSGSSTECTCEACGEPVILGQPQRFSLLDSGLS